MKIGIIGMGWVGSSVAISTLHSGIATELLVHGLNTGLAEGEALDLAQGASFYPAASVRSASIEEIRVMPSNPEPQREPSNRWTGKRALTAHALSGATRPA